MTSRTLRRVLAAALMVAAIAWPASASASTSFDLYGHFKESFGRPASADPCDLVPPFCGEGTVRGLGSATTLFFPGGTKWIILDSDGSTLVMHETLNFLATPGGSANAPGSAVSYGNPVYLEVSWVADPGLSTGIFARATGSGITIVTEAGDAIVVDTSGTLTLQ